METRERYLDEGEDASVSVQGGRPRATQRTRSQAHAGHSADGTLGAAWTTLT